MVRKFPILAAAVLALGVAQAPALAQQYGPPSSGTSAAILFTPATLGLVAGLNGAGYSGNGGLATAAQLNFPWGIAYDSNGNLYITERANYVVRKVSTAGVISTVAGTNTIGSTTVAPPANTQATSWALGAVTGLAIDSSNNLYFADQTNNVIWKVAAATGVITVFAGTPGTSGYTGDGSAATSATIYNPMGLAFDSSGNLYVADTGNNVVRVIGTNGKINTFAGNGTGHGQFDACPSAFSGAGGLATAAALCNPQGVAADSAGNIYVSSYTYSQVYIVGTSSKINVFAGTGAAPGSSSPTYTGDGGAAISAELWRPEGLYADPAGDIYIVDQFGGEIREVNTAGTINTIYGIGSGDVTKAVIGLSDLEPNALGVGDANGIYFIAMDPYGDLIVPSADSDVVFTAGSTGQYRFPTTQIFTTETTTQAHATSAFYPAYITISNPSGVTLNFTGTPQVTGPFAIVTGTGAGTCAFPGSLSAGQFCTVVMSFTPTLGGSPGTVQTGSIVIASNANSSPSTISLIGTGDGTATISATLTPSPLNFTSPVGVASAAQQATLTNTGQVPIAIGSTNFNGGSASDFAVSATTCPSGSATLAVGATCTYNITFTPPSATTFAAGFQACISTSSYGCLQSITLQGTGTAAPTATFLPTPLAFGNVVQGQTSATMSATLANTSASATLNVSSFTITGTNPADFAITTGTNACGSTLAAGSSCLVYVTFTPAAASSYSAQLSVADTAASSPQTVSLTGTGVAPTVAPSPLVFNAAPVGISLASAQTLTATFQVNGYAGGFTPTAKLHYGLSFSIGAVNCSGAAGSETCSVPVTFQPQYPGDRRDALFLMNGTTVLSSVFIGGIGQAPFALVQPGLITNPILNNANYLYQSTVGEDGTAYITGDNSNSVYSVTKAGVVTQLPIAGLSSPHGIAIDGAGTLYIAQNTYSKQIITYTAAGVQGTLTVVPPAPYVPCSNSNGGTLEYLYSVAVDQTGNIFVLEILCGVVMELKTDGTYATTTFNPVLNPGPSSIALDSTDNVFLGGGSVIYEVAKGAAAQTIINPTGGGADGLGVDAADTLYATRYTGTGGVAELPATGYGTLEAALDLGSSPLGASVGPDGTVYVGNYTNLDKVDRSQGVVAFGELTVNTTSAAQNIAIYNGGNQPLTISNIAISGTGFVIQAATTNNCSNGIVVAVGALCQVAVTVTEANAGVFSGTLTITSNSLNNSSTTQTAALSAYIYGVYVTASPSPVNFPSQTVNTTSSAQTVTLTNNGDLYSANIGTPTASSPVYTVGLGTCTAGVAVGASCNLSITFKPTAAQAYNNVTVSVPYFSSGGGTAPPPATFVLNGTGTPASAPLAALSPSPLAFPGTVVGATNVLPLTLSNPGTAALTVTGISVTGTNAGSFAQTNNCGASLAAAATCTITVTFTPATAASFTASISVADNATGSPQTAAITGTGITFISNVGTALASQPVGLFFANAGTLNTIQVLTQGATGLDFTSATGGTCATGTAYTAGQYCTVDVVFTPKFAGTRAGAVLLSDGSGNPLATAYLPGTGNGPQIVFAPGTSRTVSTTGLNQGFGITVDASDNVYIPDRLNNRVIKVPRTGSTYGAQTLVPTTGLSSPWDMTVDGGGNLYIADSGNNRVVKVPWTGSAYGTQTIVPTSHLIYPQGIAVDGNGNVYMTEQTGDTLSSNIVKVPWTGTGYGAQTAVGTGVGDPVGIKVDGSGNVFVVDADTNSVVKIPWTGSAYGAPTTVPTTGLSTPSGVGLDGSGDVYVADTTNGRVIKVAWNGTTYGAQTTIATGLDSEAGVAVDGSGNLFIDNSYADQVIEVDFADPPTLSFAASNVGSTSTDSPKTVTVQNIGNAALAFAVPTSGSNPSYPTNFPVNIADTSLCASGTPLAEGATCDVSVSFTPTASGSLSGNIVLTDNQLNVSSATQSIAVSGTGNAAAAPVAALSPNSLAFPGTTVGSTATALPVTLSNTGNAALTGISFNITGTNPSDFATTSATTCGATLAAGASCTIYVSFTPASAAGFSATLSVADNASGSPQTAALTGTGTAPLVPQSVLSPNPLAFPSTLVGTAATPLPMTLSNPGTAALTITGISVTGANASSFGESNNCSTSLAAGASCTISVTFTPGAASNLSAAISVADNASGSPQTATLTGTGTAPQAALAPNPLAFPATIVSTAATPLPMTLSNPGTAALTITGISVTGTNASSFGETNNCGTSLAAGASCSISVTFTPGSAGNLSAAISVADNATGSPQSAAITGTGTAPQAVLSPNPLAFPATTVSTAATPLPMTLSNPGTAPLTITGISVTGTNASSFGESNNCGTSLAAGASCTITVTFTPGSAASLSASISVTDNATGSPQSAAITGTGTAPLVPQAVLSPNPLAFPTTTVTTSATPLPMTLSNPGTAPLTITGISVTGANASSFGETNNCGTSLAAGASCTVTVTFTPASATSFSAAISVSDNATGSPQSAAITGTGSAGTYVVNSSTPSESVQPGAVAQFNIQVNPLGGSYTNLVTLSATGLPTGASVTFQPASVTPGSAGATSVMSIQTPTGLARLTTPQAQRQNPMPLLAILAGLPLLGLAGSLRRLRRSSGRWMILGLALLTILPALALSGCGGGYFGPAAKTYTVTVVGTSGSLQESTTISLTVQ